jgi:hypothetical protein
MVRLPVPPASTTPVAIVGVAEVIRTAVEVVESAVTDTVVVPTAIVGSKLAGMTIEVSAKLPPPAAAIAAAVRTVDPTVTVDRSGASETK